MVRIKVRLVGRALGRVVAELRAAWTRRRAEAEPESAPVAPTRRGRSKGFKNDGGKRLEINKRQSSVQTSTQGGKSLEGGFLGQGASHGRPRG